MRRLPNLIRKAKPWIPAWRQGEAIYVDGKPSHRNPATFYVRALYQPLSGSQVLILPEGDRKTESYTLYQDPSQSVFAGTKERIWMPLQLNDKVNLFEDAAFIILKAHRWPGGAPFIEAVAQRIATGDTKNIPFPPRSAELG